MKNTTITFRNDLRSDFYEDKKLVKEEIEKRLTSPRWFRVVERRDPEKMRLDLIGNDWKSVKQFIKSIKIDNLEDILEDEHERFKGQLLFQFNCFHNGTNIYIKLKFLKNRKIKIISFHP
ncbi:hypothetical protein [Thioflexithrix psekupsensis]|uniref:Uncharacterized protein n=1 Tax=Thioflexithrix psekupsensis TaxID=1570016 RepID=A0A251XC50_9GAMM|nr:hypothetical protein [Thioflexithrix psekupsensis]OUD16306.1 hypothetical protein TPSD3_00875 [Thioflexithrix psekupsensis]